MSKHSHAHHYEYEPGCLPLPRFERVKYFYGQLLGVREFQSEQSYFLEKHRLHNRYLHGYGVVCGLEVKPCREPRDPCAPEPAQHREPQQDAHRTSEPPPKICVAIDCGIALDCRGNEIVVPWPTEVDLLAKLGCDERDRFLAGEPVYLSLCFVEQPLEPVRPLAADSCGGLLPDCVPSRLRDDYCIRLSLEPPAHDRSCAPCERPCCDPCLPLAKLQWKHGLHVHNDIRRTLASFVPTRIEGVSWVHAGVYAPGIADAMLREGLVIRFTDDVYTTSLQDGVLDVWVIQGGGGRSGDIYNAGLKVSPSNPDHELSRSVIARLPDDPGERRRHDKLDPGDRVLIQLRSAFVLDRCCRPIDGDHVGGLVPHLDLGTNFPVVEKPELPRCHRPEPRPFMPWSSGNGTPAGNFESWIHVGEDDE